MPELPEVEVVRRGLQEHIVGARFAKVKVLHPRAARKQDAPLADLLAGARVEGLHRCGKYLWMHLPQQRALLVHLGMSGQMLLGSPGSCTSRHLRIHALLETASEPLELAFVDQRTFGYWHYTALCEGQGQRQVPLPVAKIAVDPLEDCFDIVATARALRKSSSAIKTALLNQNIVSGIGNIYADEALWEAGISPKRSARRLLQREAVALLEAAQNVMKRALAAGGTSFDSLYVNVNGASGYFARDLNAYGRTDLPCHRCAEPINRMTINGRSAHYCARCQV